MELMKAIEARRSVRAYKPDQVEKEKIEKILHAAVMAPTGMNAQPWAFGIIQNKAKLDDLDERSKQFMLDSMEAQPWVRQYEENFRDPNYHVFYGAPALVVIYTKNASPISRIDCCLAAENLMLAACDLGLGTCWIGFSHGLLDQPELKQELGVPEEYQVAAPIIVGYPAGETPAREKNPPEVAYWK